MSNNSIRTIMNTPVAAEFAAHWKTFINGGLTFNFLRDVVQTRITLEKTSGESIDFTKYSEGAIRLLMEDGSLPFVKSKIVLGCLTAIKGVHYRPDAKGVIDRMLAASKSAGITDIDSSLQADVAAAFRFLLSTNPTITDFEALLHKDAVKTDNTDLSIAMNSNGEEYYMVPSNFKSVADLTYKSLETFPFLLKVNIEQEEVKKFMDEMIKDDIVSYAIRAVIYFPDQINIDYLRHMEVTLTEGDKFWDLFADILVFLSRLRNKYQDPSTAFANLDEISENLEMDEDDAAVSMKPSSSSKKGNNARNAYSAGISVLQDDSKSQKQMIKLLVSAIHARKQLVSSTTTSTTSAASSKSLMNISDQEFNQHVLQYIQFCMESATTLSFRAGITVAERLNRYDILSEIKLQSLTKHYTGLVEKDRWRVALMGAHTMDRKILLFNLLVKNGKFQEANMLYDEENLKGYVRPVDQKSIQRQLQHQASIYLPFPHEKVRVMMVDSLESLQYMTEVIGIPFPEDGMNTNTSTATGKRSSRFVQLPTLQEAFTNGLVTMRQSIAMTEVITNTMTTEIDKAQDTVMTTQSTTVYQDIQYPEQNHIKEEEQKITTKTTTTHKAPSHTNKRTHANTNTTPMKPSDPKQSSSPVSSSTTSSSVDPNHAFDTILSSEEHITMMTKHKKQHTTCTETITMMLPPLPPSPPPSSQEEYNNTISSGTSSKMNAPISTRIQNIIGLDTEWDVAVQDTLVNTIKTAKNASTSSSSSSRSNKSPSSALSPSQQQKGNKEISDMNGDEGGADILQIATVDHAFIVDLYAIGNNTHRRKEAEADRLEKLTAQVIGQLFLDNSILKVAFDFYNEDMKKLSQVGKKGHFAQSIQGISNLLDISRTEKSSKDAKVFSSLSSACERFLGKPLNKAERLSPWTHRPLSTPQLHYASLDAHCLIGITDALLLEQSMDMKINVARSLYQIKKE